MNGHADCWKRWASLPSPVLYVECLLSHVSLFSSARGSVHTSGGEKGEAEEGGGEEALTRLVNALGGLRLVLLAAAHLFIY